MHGHYQVAGEVPRDGAEFMSGPTLPTPMQITVLDPESGPLKSARAFHFAAGQLAVSAQATLGRITKGEYVQVEQHLGQTAGAVVLEALALELVLKVRRRRLGLPALPIHDHLKLYADLKKSDQEEAAKRFDSHCTSQMSSTLEQALTGSCRSFESWRYMSEREGSIDANIAEMRCAFEALDFGL